MRTLFILTLMLTSLVLRDETPTGSSYCNVRLTPAATGTNGTVLFKTFFQLNETGGYIHVPVEMGWLVVSAGGVWDYVPRVRLTFDDGNYVSADDSVQLQAFESPFRFDSTDRALTTLVKKYRINKIVSPHLGRNTVSWKKDGVYKKANRISTKNNVQSIFDVVNDPEEGSPVSCSFYYEGVVLFRSEQRLNENEDDVITVGPKFFNGAKYHGEELWIELYKIDALTFLKH